MPEGIPGKDQIIKIHDGANPGAFIALEYQGTAKYSTGKQGQLKKTKNGFVPYRSEDGATIVSSFTRMRPMPAGQQRLWDVAKSGDLVQVEYEDEKTGGLKRAGTAQITLADEDADDDNPIEQEFTIAFTADPTESVTA